MEGIYLEVIDLTFTSGNSLQLKNVRYAQKGNVMVLEDSNGFVTVINFDNILYFTYTEQNKKTES